MSATGYQGGSSSGNLMVEEDVLEPWVDCGVVAVAVEAAFFLAGPTEGMDCLQPTNKRFRLTINMVTGFSIGWNLTVMIDYYEHSVNRPTSLLQIVNWGAADSPRPIPER